MFIFSKIKLYLLIGGLLAAFAGAGYLYYKDSQERITILTENNVKLESAVESQKEAIDVIQLSFTVQAAELINLAGLNQELQAERNALNSIINGHDWEAISRAKPGLMEKRINDGTKDLFDSFIAITTN